MSKIEWTDKTWNPLVGCSKVSEGCRNCYAVSQAYRNHAMGQKLENPGRLIYYDGLTEKRGVKAEWTGKVVFVPEALEIPLKTRKPAMWFVNSMSDLFHESVTNDQLRQIWEVMHEAHKRHGHIFQILTKRPERMAKALGPDGIGWYAVEGNVACPEPGIWLGVTVENQKAANERIPILLNTPATVRFLSAEPMLEEIDLSAGVFIRHDSVRRIARKMSLNYEQADSITLDSVNWVIVGGESGHGARECRIEWIRSVVQQCQTAHVPVFVKQLGSFPVSSFNSESLGESIKVPVPIKLSDRKGGNIDEFPTDLRIREYPILGGVAA